MNARRVLAIMGKDVRDALRDGRVLVLLILPIALGIFYNSTVKDDNERPKADVVVAGPGAERLASELRKAAGKSVDVSTDVVADEAAARRQVARGDADLGVVGQASGGGGPARASVLLPEDAGPSAQGLAAFVPDAATRAAGEQPSSQVQTSSVAQTDQKPADKIEDRQLIVLFSLVMLAAFVAMLVVPIQMAEELETGTFGALRLAATGPEVLVAKALAGMVYGIVGVAITVAVTGLEIDNYPIFALAALGLVASLIGFGLLFGLLVANTTVINTYGGFLLLPLLGLALAVFFFTDGIFGTVLKLLPFSQASRLMGDALSPEQPFGSLGILPWVVIVAWIFIGAALLARIAQRREL